MEATEGELLTPDGWDRASQLFAQHDTFPANSSVRIVSNYWGVEHSSVSNNTAEVDMGYTDAGTVDASLFGSRILELLSDRVVQNRDQYDSTSQPPKGNS